MKCTQGTKNQLPTSKKKKKSLGVCRQKADTPKKLQNFFQHHSGAYTRSVRRCTQKCMCAPEVYTRYHVYTSAITWSVSKVPKTSYQNQKKKFVLTSNKKLIPKKTSKIFSTSQWSVHHKCTQKCTQGTRSVRKVPCVHFCDHMKCTQGTKNRW